MIFEQKIIEAKATRRKQYIKVTAGFVIASLLCAWVVFFISSDHTNDEIESIPSSDSAKIEKKKEVINTAQSPSIPDDQLRQTYISALSYYENKLKPELDKIDLARWDYPQSQQLDRLNDEALAKFSTADYAGTVSSMEHRTQLAQTMITASQREFVQALSNAQSAYNADRYEEANIQVAKALMLEKTSLEAETLSIKINKLPEILTLVEKINTARIENNTEKELSLIKQLVKLAPERKSAIKRQHLLLNALNHRNFKSYIAQAHQAIKRGNTEKAKQTIRAAKKIFPDRQEIGEATTALQALEKKQRFGTYQQKAQSAMAADDWEVAKKQLELALQEHADDKSIQQSLQTATAIISLNNTFEKQIKKPYRLSNKQLAAKMSDKINKAAAFVDMSPSLRKKTKKLSYLIQSMNKKIPVEIVSDNKTHILLRGVGIVGKTTLKTIQLTPGRYSFEGKRKGYKSKLVNVLIPYEQTSYRISLHCDEPI